MNAEQAEEAAKPVYVPLSEAHKPQEDNIVLTLEQRRAKLEAQLKELEELEAVEAPVEEADDKDAMLAGFVGLKTNLSMLKHLRENFDVDLPKSSKRPEIVAKYKELIEY
jgi:hypothetical protein